MREKRAALDAWADRLQEIAKGKDPVTRGQLRHEFGKKSKTLETQNILLSALDPSRAKLAETTTEIVIAAINAGMVQPASEPSLVTSVYKALERAAGYPAGGKQGQ